MLYTHFKPLPVPPMAALFYQSININDNAKHFKLPYSNHVSSVSDYSG